MTSPRDPMWYWRQNNVPWVPNADELARFRKDIDAALNEDRKNNRPDDQEQS